MKCGDQKWFEMPCIQKCGDKRITRDQSVLRMLFQQQIKIVVDFDDQKWDNLHLEEIFGTHTQPKLLAKLLY